MEGREVQGGLFVPLNAISVLHLRCSNKFNSKTKLCELHVCSYLQNPGYSQMRINYKAPWKKGVKLHCC